MLSSYISIVVFTQATVYEYKHATMEKQLMLILVIFLHFEADLVSVLVRTCYLFSDLKSKYLK